MILSPILKRQSPFFLLCANIFRSPYCSHIAHSTNARISFGWCLLCNGEINTGGMSGRCWELVCVCVYLLGRQARSSPNPDGTQLFANRSASPSLVVVTGLRVYAGRIMCGYFALCCCCYVCLVSTHIQTQTRTNMYTSFDFKLR